MPLKLYDTKELVPEAQRAAAIETKDSKWAVEEVDPALGAAGKKAIEDERTARAAADVAAKAAKDALKLAEKERDDLKLAAEALGKGITADALKAIQDREAAARKPLEDQNAALAAENRKLKLWEHVRRVGLEKGIMKERIEMAMRDLEAQKRVDLTADGTGHIVRDAKGNVTTESLEDFLAKTYRAEALFLYEGTGSSGSGTGGSDGGGGGDEATKAAAAGKAQGVAQKKANTEANALALR